VIIHTHVHAPVYLKKSVHITKHGVLRKNFLCLKKLRIPQWKSNFKCGCTAYIVSVTLWIGVSWKWG